MDCTGKKTTETARNPEMRALRLELDMPGNVSRCIWLFLAARAYIP